jgi:hypothetical protein
MTPRLEPLFGVRSVLAAMLVAGCVSSNVPRPGPESDDDGSAPPGNTGGGGGSKGPASLDAAEPGGEGGAGGAVMTPDAASKPDVAAPADARVADSAPVTNTGDAKPSTNPPAGPAGPWARGVKIGLVEVTQGVFIKIGMGDTVVAPDMRNGPLIEGRPLYARIHVATDGGFSARMLRAVLSIEYGDGTKFEIEDKKMISGSSTEEKLESSFNFLVPAASVKPKSSLVASVYETGAGTGPDPTPPPRFPATGNVDLAIKEGRMEMTVVAIPVGMLMDSPARRQKLEDDVYDLYPVQKINLRIHEPVMLPGAFSSSAAFTLLRDLREKENAKPHEYYHLLINTSGAGFSGTSNRAGPGINDGARRIAITIVRTPAIDGNTNTVAHELGHNNGRAHTPGCGAAGPDNMYPYPNPPGFSGVDGFSLVNMAFKSKAMWRDLMSYCRPRWISDYVWDKFEERVRIVSAFPSAGGMTTMMASRSLQGFAGPGETPQWGIVAGKLVDESALMSATQFALLNLTGGRQVKVPVMVEELGEGDPTRAFSVNLTGTGFTDSEVMSAQVTIDGQMSIVPVGGMARRR